MLKLRLKTSAIVVAPLLAAVTCPIAKSTTLTINGNLTTTPCLISSPTVVLGRVPVIEFGANGGMGANYTKDFSLQISGCEIETLRTASLTFTGTTVTQLPNATGLAITPVSGAAQGIAITLKNNDSVHGTFGQDISFNGLATYPLDVASGKNTYELRASYTRIPGQSVVPGAAAGTATVTITYN
jgi:type 1 fimbria pilin